MGYRTGITVAASMVLLLAATSAWPQATTGRLIGRVIDDDGAPLPGVAVTIASPALIGGAQQQLTDEWGEVGFLGLAPGEYTVRAEHEGFIPQERARVKVSLGHAVALTIAMPQGTFTGEITVVDETPVVDPTQVNTGQIFEHSYMQNSAIGSDNRDYLVVITQTAGVVGGSWGAPQAAVFGSTIGENAYFIDGVDTTDPAMATATVPMNFDSVQEIQFQTGGFEAEYGRATGGIINLVTRSGGNRYSGTIDVRYRDQSFQESGDHFDTSELDSRYHNIATTLGGPIVRDRVWFFASYQWTNDEFTPIGSPTTREGNEQNHLAKITWQIDPGWRLTGKYSHDFMRTDNGNASRWRTPEATSAGRDRIVVLSTELSAVLSDTLLWNTTVGVYRVDTETYPQSGDLQTIGHYNYDTGLSTHNAGNQQYWGSDRDDFTTDLTLFVDDLAGSHEFKAGVEYSDITLPDEGFCTTGTPNGERCVEGVPGFFFYDIESEGGTLPFFMLENYGYTEAKYSGAVSTLFVQDAWRVTRDLTLKLGLRHDMVSYDNDAGTEVVDMDKLQPRLGFAWDLTGNARSVLRGSWGRFMHPGSLSIPGLATTQKQQYSFWYSCSGVLPLYFGITVGSPEECSAVASDLGWRYRLDHEAWDPYGWVLAPWEQIGTGAQLHQVDPTLRATYADELILAFEREVGTRSSIEISYVDKRTRDLFEDTCHGNVPTPSADAECDYYTIANLSALRRDYEGFILRYETRGLDWLTLLASYTYSSSKGSIGYTQYATNTADVYPWHFDNTYGYLGDHRRHRLKLNGYVTLAGDWTFAFDGFWSSPYTWTPYEDRIDNPEIPYGVHFLEPRGSREANRNYQLDLQLAKGFTIGSARMVLIGSVYNLFSNEQPAGVCEQISGCGEIEMGDPVNWQTPRRYELGFRVEF